MKCSEFLTRVCEDRRLTQQKIADGIGVTRQAVSRWMNGVSVPYGRNLEKLSKFLNVSPEIILFGNSTVIASPQDFESNENPSSFLPEGFVAIPDSKMTASAGEGSENSWSDINESLPTVYRESFFKSRRIDPKKCKRITADGDSMYPFICDGDKILLCHTHNLSLQEIHDGDVYVICIFGKLRVKRLATVKNGLVVRSDNPQYKEETYYGDELNDIVVLGKVIEITRIV